MTKPAPSLDDLLAMLSIGMEQPTIAALGQEHPEIADAFAAYDPFKLASSFGALLMVPELQCCCVRLEALAQLALLHGAGKRKAEPKVLSGAFETLGKGRAGMMEDPAEDVFVTSIGSSRGNFRVLEGIWETAGFFLQRFVNIIEEMPEHEPFATLRENVFALLKLSDLACERAGLIRWQTGNIGAMPTLPPNLASEVRQLRRALTFSKDELARHDISLDYLAPFIFPASLRPTLSGQTLGNSILDHAPVLLHNDAICFGLPTAVSAAIRRAVIDFAAYHDQLSPLVRHLGAEYAKTFSRVPFLGSSVTLPIKFRHTDAGAMAAIMMKADTGRYLNLIFVLDTLKGFDPEGLSGTHNDIAALQGQIASLNSEARATAQTDPEFRDGITLTVSCGVGRGLRLALDKTEDPNWRHEFASASDVHTLSWTKGFEPLSLWRLLDAEAKVRGAGVELSTLNGLLNRVAWRRSLDGHMVPHGSLPDDFGQGEQQTLLMIDQTSLRGLREDAVRLGDPHAIQDVEGRWIRVRREASSFFKEDLRQPSYYPEDLTATAGLPNVYEASTRPWWCEVAVDDDNGLDAMTYERWKMVETWNARIAQVLDASLKTLPPGPTRWRVHFAGEHPRKPGESAGYEVAKGDITVEVDPTRNTVDLRIGLLFERAYLNVENIAERALAERVVEGFLKLANDERDAGAVQRLVDRIVRDPKARQTHTFRNGGFRDRVRLDKARDKTVFINEDDEADLRLGLGWRVRDRALGGEITGKQECTSFLNALVRILEDELCADLRKFDRKSFLQSVLKNHEAAADERRQWERTVSAVLALHEDKEGAYAVIAKHEARLAAVSQTSRTLCEIALCECPLSDGKEPGKLDLTRLMAKTALIVNFGGWSDAIWLDAVAPRVRVTALGDIHIDHEFIDEVVMPFGRATSDVRTNEAVKNYGRNLEEVPFVESVEHNFEPDFLDATVEELGAGVDEIRVLIEHIENLAVVAGQNIISVPRSKLLSPQVEGRSIPPERARALVNALSIPRRNQWRELHSGFSPQDIQPWRYRRPLSLLRRPLLQLDEKEDPTFVIAPGLLRDGFGYFLVNLWRGDFPQHQLGPKMRSWRGTATNERGTAFNTEVAERVRELGWQARPDVNVSTILGAAFKRYGDIDVLAWHSGTGRILLIECKDLHFGKTFGEIAEQLSEFRGLLRASGKPDQLRKHLDRIELLRAQIGVLGTFVGLGMPPAIEGHLVFKNPVPMAFAGARISAQVNLHIFDNLAATLKEVS